MVEPGQLEDSFDLAETGKPATSPRRGYGQGSLKEIEPGLWRMRVHLGNDPIAGKMVQPSRRFRGTRAAAERHLAASDQLAPAPGGPTSPSTNATSPRASDGHRSPS